MTLRPILFAAAVASGLLIQSQVGAQTAPAAAAPAAGDPVKGQAVFGANCSTCHTDAKTSADSTTLSLYGVVGRKSGANADFSYSPAMTSANVTWTPDKLNAYLENPPSVVPGNVMYFPGLPDAADRANLIAYLSTLK
jgi:cytochrome c